MTTSLSLWHVGGMTCLRVLAFFLLWMMCIAGGTIALAIYASIMRPGIQGLSPWPLTIPVLITAAALATYVGAIFALKHAFFWKKKVRWLDAALEGILKAGVWLFYTGACMLIALFVIIVAYGVLEGVILSPEDAAYIVERRYAFHLAFIASLAIGTLLTRRYLASDELKSGEDTL